MSKPIARYSWLTARRANRFATVVIACIALTSASPSQAHEVWIAPADYQVASGKSTTAGILNGEKFVGSDLYYNPDETVRLERHHNGTVTAVPGRLGDTPAIRTGPLADGLHVFVYQSKPTDVYYREWARFAKFADHKNFADIEARHAARGLPREKFREAYARFAKALVVVGSGKGADRATGMETEFVALANPYTTTAETFPVRLLYQGKARAGAQVEMYEKATDDTVAVTLHRTDAAGEVDLPVKPGYRYLIDAVVLREPAPALAKELDAAWETLWAALTFAVPSR